MGLPGFEPGSQGPKPRRLNQVTPQPLELLKEKGGVFKYFLNSDKRFIYINIHYDHLPQGVSMAKEEKKSGNKEKYDVADIVVIDDKKKDEDFDLGREELEADDDELDFEEMEFDDGGD